MAVRQPTELERDGPRLKAREGCKTVKVLFCWFLGHDSQFQRFYSRNAIGWKRVCARCGRVLDRPAG